MVNLLAAKSIVVPLQRITLSSLELIEAVLLAQRITMLKQQISQIITRAYLWTDSLTALCATCNMEYVYNKPNNADSKFDDIVDCNYAKCKDNAPEELSRSCCPAELKEWWPWWLGLYS